MFHLNANNVFQNENNTAHAACCNVEMAAVTVRGIGQNMVSKQNIYAIAFFAQLSYNLGITLVYFEINTNQNLTLDVLLPKFLHLFSF